MSNGINITLPNKNILDNTELFLNLINIEFFQNIPAMIEKTIRDNTDNKTITDSTSKEIYSLIVKAMEQEKDSVINTSPLSVLILSILRENDGELENLVKNNMRHNTKPRP